MFKSISHQRNIERKNHNEWDAAVHPSEGPKEESGNSQSAEGTVNGGLTHSGYEGTSLSGAATVEVDWQFLRTTTGPRIGTYSREIQQHVHVEPVREPMLVAGLFFRAPDRKQPWHPLIGRWLNCGVTAPWIPQKTKNRLLRLQKPRWICRELSWVKKANPKSHTPYDCIDITLLKQITYIYLYTLYTYICNAI